MQISLNVTSAVVAGAAAAASGARAFPTTRLTLPTATPGAEHAVSAATPAVVIPARTDTGHGQRPREWPRQWRIAHRDGPRRRAPLRRRGLRATRRGMAPPVLRAMANAAVPRIHDAEHSGVRFKAPTGPVSPLSLGRVRTLTRERNPETAGQPQRS